MHQYFLAHHVRRFAPQDVHAHGGFDIPKKQFDIPALEIKISDVVSWIVFSIEQGGDNVKRIHSEAWLIHGDFDLPQ